MKYRELANTGIYLSEVGFGAWGIGGATAGATSYGNVDDNQSKAALESAFDAGITFFDTAPSYGDGHSESLLGDVFRTRRTSVLIGTKAGLDSFSKAPNFSATRIEASVLSSLIRLKTDYVDILQLHNPTLDDLSNNEDLKSLLERLRTDGKVRAFGISLKTPKNAPKLVKLIRPDILQMNYNLLDHRAADDGVFDWVKDEKIGVIVRTPLCFGFLSGHINEKSRFAPNDHRAAWPRKQILRWIEAGKLMRDGLKSFTMEPPAVTALRFCLSFDAVTTVIPGMLTTAEVEVNAQASNKGPLPRVALESIARIYAEFDSMINI